MRIFFTYGIMWAVLMLRYISICKGGFVGMEKPYFPDGLENLYKENRLVETISISPLSLTLDLILSPKVFSPLFTRGITANNQIKSKQLFHLLS